MSESVTEFYDRLSPMFHTNMGYDWEAEVRWHVADASGYYQPIVTARNR